jgi:hypothetical protein
MLKNNSNIYTRVNINIFIKKNYLIIYKFAIILHLMTKLNTLVLNTPRKHQF